MARKFEYGSKKVSVENRKVYDPLSARMVGNDASLTPTPDSGIKVVRIGRTNNWGTSAIIRDNRVITVNDEENSENSALERA